MESNEDSEQEYNEAILEQPESSSKISGYQSSLSNPFETLLKSSSDEEVEDGMFSLLGIDADSSDCMSTEETARVFNIGLPYIDPQILFDDEMEDNETLLTEVRDFIESIREDFGNGVFNVGPFVITFSTPSELKELLAKKGMGSASSLSNRLYKTCVGMFRYDSTRSYEKLCHVQVKAMSPLMFAALTSKSNVVYFLMKYGIRFLDETHGFRGLTDEDTPTRILCMRALMSDIVTELFDLELWDFNTLKLKTDFSTLPEGLRSKCLNFRLLLRCDPNPYVTTVKLARLNDPRTPPLPEINVLRHIYDSVFPELGLGLFSPPKLQHICRCVIRERLHENWQLPDGISQLELPKILCDYVSLLDD